MNRNIKKRLQEVDRRRTINIERSLLELDFRGADARAVHPLAAGVGGSGAVLPDARPLLGRERERRLRRRHGPPRHDREHAALPALRNDGRAGLRHVVPRLAAAGRAARSKGLASKLGYLRRLGVTALWVSPRSDRSRSSRAITATACRISSTWTRTSARAKSSATSFRAAHEQGIYVILDVIAHHTGNVFTYDADRYPARDPAIRDAWSIDARLGRQAVRLWPASTTCSGTPEPSLQRPRRTCVPPTQARTRKAPRLRQCPTAPSGARVQRG
jgi:hypothetical protein